LQARRTPLGRKTLSLLKEAQADAYTAAECLLELVRPEQADDSIEADRRRWVGAVVLALAALRVGKV
jgi:hypothetical protein